jgi:uncharacterized spore protein YtfJ
MSQTIDALVKGHRDAVTVKRVFGEPYQKNGVTVIPAAKVMGGGWGAQVNPLTVKAKDLEPGSASPRSRPARTSSAATRSSGSQRSTSTE